nr:GNAT family N-acetyltransferase [Amphibacillus marinus]
MSIRKMRQSDWKSVASIYSEGILTGNATFEQSLPSWEVWDNSHVKELRYVATYHDAVVGWSALTAISSRCVYEGVAEVSVYVASEVRGKGIGQRLLETITKESENCGFWTIQAGIFPENLGSIKLHKNNQFIEVGKRTRIGKLNGKWRDVLLFERRSKEIGID